MDRVALLRRGIALEGVTVGYNALEGIVAIAAGLADELADAEGVAAASRARLLESVAKDVFAFAVTKRYLRSPVVERIRANNRLLLPEWLDGWFSDGTRARIAAIVADLKEKGKAP